MSDVLKVHGAGTSVRTKNKNAAQPARDEKRTVFRTALSDPFNVEWFALLRCLGTSKEAEQQCRPTPSRATRRSILDELLKMLSEHKMAEQKLARKSKRGRDEVDEPVLLEAMSIGINEVTRSLESLIRWTRWQLGHDQKRRLISLRDAQDDAKTGRRKRRRKAFSALPELLNDALQTLERDLTGQTLPYLAPSKRNTTIDRLLPNCPTRKAKDENETLAVPTFIFVCKPDINPPSLVEHLPSMVALHNAALETLRKHCPAAARSKAAHDVYLVPLDQGAEQELAQALGIRRVATLSLSVRFYPLALLDALVADSLRCRLTLQAAKDCRRLSRSKSSPSRLAG